MIKFALVWVNEELLQTSLVGTIEEWCPTNFIKKKMSKNLLKRFPKQILHNSCFRKTWSTNLVVLEVLRKKCLLWARFGSTSSVSWQTWIFSLRKIQRDFFLFLFFSKNFRHESEKSDKETGSFWAYFRLIFTRFKRLLFLKNLTLSLFLIQCPETLPYFLLNSLLEETDKDRRKDGWTLGLACIIS